MPLTNSSSPQPITSSAIGPANMQIPSATFVSLLNANPSRKGATILNNTNSSISLDFMVAPTDGGHPTAVFPYAVEITAGSYYEVPYGYVGALAVWTMAPNPVGSLYVREFS